MFEELEEIFDEETMKYVETWNGLVEKNQKPLTKLLEAMRVSQKVLYKDKEVLTEKEVLLLTYTMFITGELVKEIDSLKTQVSNLANLVIDKV
jgi:hypothetical protein